jgi:ubiquitin carboxyl-terminal hydrolase 35/38
MLAAPPHLVERLAGFVTSRAVDSEQLLLAIRRVLQWPVLPGLATWCTMLLRGLIAARQFSVLNRVTLLCVHQVFFQLLVPALRSSALDLLEFMLLGFQHDPRPFHSVAGRIPAVLSSIASETPLDVCAVGDEFIKAAIIQAHAHALSAGSMIQEIAMPPTPSSSQVIMRMAIMLQCLMFHFPGFPEIYQPLLQFA